MTDIIIFIFLVLIISYVYMRYFGFPESKKMERIGASKMWNSVLHVISKYKFINRNNLPEVSEKFEEKMNPVETPKKEL